MIHTHVARRPHSPSGSSSDGDGHTAAAAVAIPSSDDEEEDSGGGSARHRRGGGGSSVTSATPLLPHRTQRRQQQQQQQHPTHSACDAEVAITILNWLDVLIVLASFVTLGAFSGGRNPGWQFGVMFGVALGSVANTYTPLPYAAPLFNVWAAYLEWCAQHTDDEHLNTKGAFAVIKYAIILVFFLLSIARVMIKCCICMHNNNRR